MNIRSGNVDVKAGLLPDEGRHKVEESNADTHSGCRLPVVSIRPVRNHDQHDPTAGSVYRPTSNTEICIPTTP